jgi:hypothetical protein
MSSWYTILTPDQQNMTPNERDHYWNNHPGTGISDDSCIDEQPVTPVAKGCLTLFSTVSAPITIPIHNAPSQPASPRNGMWFPSYNNTLSTCGPTFKSQTLVNMLVNLIEQGYGYDVQLPSCKIPSTFCYPRKF